MAVTTRAPRALQQTLGDEPAEDVINWMQKMEADTVRISDKIDLLYQQHEARLDARFAEFHRVISAEINARFNDLLKWSFVFWAGAVGAIAALAGICR
jgi:hypothetical protein